MGFTEQSWESLIPTPHPSTHTHADDARKTLSQSLSLALTQDGGIPKALHNSVGPDKGQVSRLNTTIILKCLVPLLHITELGNVAAKPFGATPVSPCEALMMLNHHLLACL